jgi:hypothetical protein
MNNITLYCKDDYLGSSEVTDNAFLSVYNLKQWQLDKMKAHGMKKGYFNYKTYKFVLYEDGERVIVVIGDEIELPIVATDKRKTKFIFTDIVNSRKLPGKNTYNTTVKIYNESMSITSFLRRADMSRNTYDKNVIRGISFKLNGVPVEITRKKKESNRFNVTNTKTNYTSIKLRSAEVLKKVNCKRLLLSKIESSGKSEMFSHFLIELDN